MIQPTLEELEEWRKDIRMEKLAAESLICRSPNCRICADMLKKYNWLLEKVDEAITASSADPQPTAEG